MKPLRLLCLFSSPALRDASLFARHEARWETDLDQGTCEFVPLVVDDELPALPASGLFAAATLLLQPEDLGPRLAAPLRDGAEAFARAALPLEVVAVRAPVTVLAWLAEEAPDLLDACRPDGEVRPESPTWWRDRARGHLARGPAPAAAPAAPAAPEDVTGALRDFVARRGW